MKLLYKKSIYKAVSWRLISIVLSFAISLSFMQSLETATKYTIVYNLIATVLYYLHELVYKWLREKRLV
jgi:uncharacterized membrane protein